MAIKWKGIVPRTWRRLKRIFLFLFILQLVYILALKWVNPPITITQFSSWISGDGLKRDYIRFEEMGTYAKLAVIASEDQLFPDHNGFDLNSIKKALENNKKENARVKGASTISQQVAKNVFLWQGRSWFRKGLEMYFTFMIELVWGKKRILEMYLNTIEMGTGVFGIQAAAKHYFNKDAAKLTRREAALIAAVLPNPKKYQINPPTKYTSSRAGWIVQQMNILQKYPGVQEVITKN